MLSDFANMGAHDKGEGKESQDKFCPRYNSVLSLSKHNRKF